MLSAFEGKQSVGGSGESLFEKIRLRDADDKLIDTYIAEAVAQMDSVIGGGLGVEFGSDGTKVTLKLSTVRKQRMAGGISTSILETISAYVMQLWLEDKEPTRSASYKQIFLDMVGALKKTIYRKREPDNDTD